MLADTHTHLYHSQFDPDREEVIHRARQAEVEVMTMPAIDLASIKAAIAICQKYDGMYAMAALHPSETREATDSDFEEVAAFCRDPNVVAVGESGLDYYWDRSFDDRQQDFLRRHIQLAIETDLPLILHNREADEDLVRILSEERQKSQYPGRLRGIFHCFQGDLQFAEQIFSLGFMIGIGGNLTFKNSRLPDTIPSIPLDKIVLETDAPYLAPVPHRGKRNEPAYVRIVAQKLADIKGTSIEDVARVTTLNAAHLFGIELRSIPV